MINKKLRYSFLFCVSFLFFSFPSFAGVKLERQMSSDLKIQKSICIRGYEESYAGFDLSILKAESLKEYGERVFLGLAERVLILHLKKPIF